MSNKAIERKGQQEILVVDDTPASLQLLTRILTEHGYRVRPASNGELASRSAAARTPDLILLDVKMPGMDGFEVCRRLKEDERSRSIPVLFVSASDETIDKVKGFEAGGVDYIIKPFEPEEVLARVRMHLRLSELTERLEQKVNERTHELSAANERLQSEIEERKRAEEAVIESRERFRNLVEATSDWVWEVDEKGVYTYVSPKVRDILGYEPEEVLGKKPFDLMPPEEAKRAGDILKGIAVYQKPFSLLENVNLNKQGFPVILETSAMPFFDEHGNFKGYRGIDRDISERKRAEETIKYQAYHDLLTGLPNRALFMDILNKEIQQMQRVQKRLVVLFLDIDCFKSVNDALGHAAGDLLIHELAVRLKNSVREMDTVARVGGDEFAILLPLLNSSSDASKMSQKIMAIFHEPFTLNALRITGSIGISVYPEDGGNAETLFKNADIAMHYAKEKGRNSCQFFNEAMNVQTLDRIMLENGLRQALERGELMVYYQPLVNIKSRDIVGAEALVRWNHPELGLLNPDRFIPLAEDIGLIASIDQWVMRVACAQLKAWQETGYPLRFVTVNLSARQFQRPDLPEIISEILKGIGLAPEALGIEITETLAMQDTELTSRNLNALNNMAIGLSIDDFGTGYSSLSYLKKLPIHKLKIDKSFITSMSKDADYRAIIDAVIAMAHILKLQVLAEGVETQDQLEFLVSRHCDEAQGNFYSEAVPARVFEEWLKQSLAVAGKA